MVRRLAIEKALSLSKARPSRLVLGADTVVVCGRSLFGKPRSRAEAAVFLRKLQGRGHTVLTGSALAAEGGKSVKSNVSRAEVFFKPLKPADLKTYLGTKEPYDKAGAYDIQGTARQWINRLEGDYFTVLGLPLGWVLQELNRTDAAV